MKHFYYIIGEVILASLLIFSTICLYNQTQTINKQKEFINELKSKYYMFEEYEEAIKLADIIFDNNNIWNNGAKESIYGSNYINALRLNGITPEMEHNIIDYEIV